MRLNGTTAIYLALLLLLPFSGNSARPAGQVLLIANDLSPNHAQSMTTAIQAELASADETCEAVFHPNWPDTFPARIEVAAALARKESAVAVVWMELVEDRVYLFLSTSKGDRILTRKLVGATDGGIDEVIAVIVRSSITALRQGGQIGISVAKIPRPIPEPPAATSHPPAGPAGEDSPTGFRMRIDSAYAYRADSARLPANHGFQFGLNLQMNPILSLVVATRFSEPLIAQTERFQVSVQRFPLYAGVQILKNRPRWTLGGYLHFGMTFQKHATLVLQETSIKEADKLRLGASLSTGLTGRYHLNNRLDLFFSVGAQIELHRIEYTEQIDDQTRILLTTWPICPVGLLGFSFRVF